MLRKMLSVSALGLLAAAAAGLTGCAYHDHDHHHGRHDRKLYRYEKHYPERHYYEQRRHHRHHHHDDYWRDC